LARRTQPWTFWSQCTLLEVQSPLNPERCHGKHQRVHQGPRRHVRTSQECDDFGRLSGAENWDCKSSMHSLACGTVVLLLGTLILLTRLWDRRGHVVSDPPWLQCVGRSASRGHGTRDCSAHGRSSTDDTPPTPVRGNYRRLSATRVLPAFSSSSKTSSAVCGAKTALLQH